MIMPHSCTIRPIPNNEELKARKERLLADREDRNQAREKELRTGKIPGPVINDLKHRFERISKALPEGYLLRFREWPAEMGRGADLEVVLDILEKAAARNMEELAKNVKVVMEVGVGFGKVKQITEELKALEELMVAPIYTRER